MWKEQNIKHFNRHLTFF